MEPEKFSEWKWVPYSEYKSDEAYVTMNPGAHKIITEFLEDKIEHV